MLKGFRTYVLFVIFIGLAQPQEVIGNTLSSDSIGRVDFWLKLRDGVMLECTKFYPQPKADSPAKGWPVMVFCHGYGSNKDETIDNVAARAKLGFYTFTYSMRGQGKSGGLSNLISQTEMHDLFEVIDYIKKDTLAQDSTRIGIFGGSQGGTIPFMAACNGLQVRSIMSDLAIPQFASNWIENGCIKSTLYYSLDYDSTEVRFDPRVLKLRHYILSSKKEDWDSLAAEMPKGRDFADKLANCETPILFRNVWQDQFFNTAMCFQNLKKFNFPFKMYFGAIEGHGSDSNEGESAKHGMQQSLWINYWLLDMKNGILDSARYSYASSRYPIAQHQWSYSYFNSPVWPCPDVQPFRLYLLQNNTLNEKSDSVSSRFLLLKNNIKKKTNMTLFINSQYEGALFNSLFKKNNIEFKSDKLKSDLQLIGQPIAHLFYSSTATVCQINIQIWEIAQDGSEAFVTRINYTDRHNIPNSIKSNTIGGQANSHIFKKGSRIKIILTNFDAVSKGHFPLNCPFVLPVLEKGESKIFTGKQQASYIELPLKSK